jgi:hypothetical protein
MRSCGERSILWIRSKWALRLLALVTGVGLLVRVDAALVAAQVADLCEGRHATSGTADIRSRALVDLLVLYQLRLAGEARPTSREAAAVLARGGVPSSQFCGF